LLLSAVISCSLLSSRLRSRLVSVISSGGNTS